MDAVDRLARWARTRLRVPSGRLRGKPYRLEPWQVDWLRQAMAPDIREAGLCCARKNGKTGMMVVPVIAYLAGDLMEPGWRAVVASATGDLATEFRLQVRDTAKASGLYDFEAERAKRAPEPGRIVVQSARGPAGRIIGGAGGEVDILSADRTSGHARGADLALLDEAGLLEERHRDLWQAIRTCLSGRDGRLWALGIRSVGPMFDEMSRRAEEVESTFWREWSGALDCAIDDEGAWAAANPGLGTIKSLGDMRAMCAEVMASPSDQASFRVKQLNQPQTLGREPVCTPEEWAECEVDELPPREGPATLGFDVGFTNSMTAAVAYWPETGRLEHWAAFPAEPNLLERGRLDAVGRAYAEMVDAGDLMTLGRRTLPVEEFLQIVAGDVGEVSAAAADSYRQAQAQDALETAGVHWPMDWRANASGPDGSHDLVAFQRAIHEGRIRVKRSRVWRQALVGADVKKIRAAGYPTLGRSRSRDRIDVLAAAVLAVGIASGGGAPDLGAFILTEMYK